MFFGGFIKHIANEELNSPRHSKTVGNTGIKAAFLLCVCLYLRAPLMSTFARLEEGLEESVSLKCPFVHQNQKSERKMYSYCLNNQMHPLQCQIQGTLT